jgi:hypothetical protein
VTPPSVSQQTPTGPKRRKWVNEQPTHDLVLTDEYLAAVPAGTVLSVLMKAGSGHRLPISFVKRHDAAFEVHSRGSVTADRLVGGQATLRRRAGAAGRAGLSGEVPLEPMQVTTPESRRGFATAAVRMLGAGE